MVCVSGFLGGGFVLFGFFFKLPTQIPQAGSWGHSGVLVQPCSLPPAPRGNLFSCSHGLFLPKAKLILKVGQKGGKNINQLRPSFLTHLGTAVSEPEPSPASSAATKGMSQSVGHHVTLRLSQQPQRKMAWETGVMT